MPRASNQGSVRFLNSAHWDEKKMGMSYEDFRRGMDDYTDDRLWFYKNLDELRKEYTNRWVAIINKRVIDSDGDHDELVTRMMSRTNGLSGVHILLVRPKDMPVIY
jgi:hypothetical protein